MLDQNKIEALALAGKEYLVTLENHRNNPRDTNAAGEWDTATSRFSDLIGSDAENIVAGLLMLVEEKNKRIAELEQVSAYLGQDLDEYGPALSNHRSYNGGWNARGRKVREFLNSIGLKVEDND